MGLGLGLGMPYVGGGGGQTPLFKDSMTDADATALTAHVPGPINPSGYVWSTSSGAPVITDNHAAAAAASSAMLATFPLADHIVEAVFNMGGTSNVKGLLVRRTTSNNEWRLGYSSSSATLSIVERNAGVNTTRASTSASQATGVDFVMRSTCRGASITIENVTLGVGVTYSSATFQQTTGIVGYLMGQSADRMDDFTVYA